MHLICRAGLHHSGVYVCQAVIGDGMKTLKEVSVDVVGWETRFCPLQHMSTEKGRKQEAFITYHRTLHLMASGFDHSEPTLLSSNH